MATVLYSRATLGMGLGFREVKPEFQRVLRKWLRQALEASNAACHQSTMANQKRIHSESQLATTTLAAKTRISRWRLGTVICFRGCAFRNWRNWIEAVKSRACE
jgi:hypothetical protein